MHNFEAILGIARGIGCWVTRYHGSLRRRIDWKHHLLWCRCIYCKKWHPILFPPWLPPDGSVAKLLQLPFCIKSGEMEIHGWLGLSRQNHRAVFQVILSILISCYLFSCYVPVVMSLFTWHVVPVSKFQLTTVAPMNSIYSADWRAYSPPTQKCFTDIDD